MEEERLPQNCCGSEHQLWVSLSALAGGNVFAVLPQLMRDMFNESATILDDEFVDDNIDVILPSDFDWQTKIYYKLVERQRQSDTSSNADEESTASHEEKETKLHDWNITEKHKNPQCDTAIVRFRNSRKKCGVNPITWTVTDISKAGHLLAVPPKDTNFGDEQEMRRVYTLIYDVFRYKSVLMQALNDVYFFQKYPKLIKCTPHVWLLFFDLFHRSFKERETNVAEIAIKLFSDAELINVEMALWQERVRLAASISRLRIAHNALSLSDLLPEHLKDERVSEQAKHAPVTCWVNSNKIEDASKLCEEIERQFRLTRVDDMRHLQTRNYKWDVHCPRIIAFHSTMRANLARSDLTRDHKLILQDRSFCLGPATFDKLVSDLELCGSVIQTHVNSPRSTAYLAVLLSHNEKIKRLMAFSAGKRKTEYEDYFHELGMKNISIFSDRLIDCPADAGYMEEVVAVYATPPNSYSAVADPIDLVCSRGGDLSMLEVLTESEDTKEGRERVADILNEQRKTLKFAMSRPQIQFVLYETHSELEAENECMVKKALKETNRMTLLHHASLQGKISLSTLQQPSETVLSVEIKEINNNLKEENSVNSKLSNNSRMSDKEEKILENIKVPDTDLFDSPSVPTLCSSEISCVNPEKQGCYLALLQRKQIIRLDDKYMIQMAENRGLFGDTTQSKSKSSKSKKKVVAEPIKKQKKRSKTLEIDRIAAPTHAYLKHTIHCHEVKSCQRCKFVDNDGVTSEKHPYRRWWSETTRHIMALKASLIRQKYLLSTKPSQHNDIKAILNAFVNNSCKVDEIAAKTNQMSRIPVFPKLRLTREFHIEKVPVQVNVTTLQFVD